MTPKKPSVYDWSPMQIGILAPDLKSIEELFAGDVRFIVPRYQRSFAWTSDETEELWDDLISAVSRGSEYFLGTVVLNRKESEPHEIIDGQQRMACITMLFSAIRNVFLASSDERAVQIEMNFLGSKNFAKGAVLTPKLSLNKINNETFLQHILASENLSSVEVYLKGKGIKASNRLLLEAYRFFLSKVVSEAASKGTQADSFLVPLIDTLRNRVKLIAIPVISDEDANLFFESLNARGKELAISDLVKNRIYFETGGQVPRAEQLWEQMESELARRPVPEYIRHYWIAKKTDATSPIVREKHLYRMVAKSVKGNQAAALDLVKDLSDSAASYARISDANLWPDDPAYDDSFSDSLAALQLFRVTQMNPLLLNVIQTFTVATDIARTFRIVANFAFRYFIIGNQSPGNLERESAKIAHEIRAKTATSPSHVADALRAVNPDTTFRSDFALAVMMDRKKLARYLLAKLNNFMAKQSSQTGAEQIANPDAKQVTLEHVLPQDLPAHWVSGFSAGSVPGDFVYRIGNLTLLTAKINRAAADKSFLDKKAVALDTSTLKINEFFKTRSTWNDTDIEQRQEALAKTALEVWKI